MIFDLSDEQTAIRDTVARFVQDNYNLPPRYAMGEDKLSHWHDLAELGLLAVATPEAGGGLGLPPEDWSVIVAELGRGLADEPFLVTAILAPVLLGDGMKTASLLQELIAGGTRIAVALTEPRRRYALLEPACRVDGQPNGAVLTGIKSHVEYGADADVFLVSARNAAGLVELHAVDADASGLRIESYRSFEGRMLADVALEATPSRALVSAGEEAVAAIDRAIDIAATMQSAEALGLMEAAIDLTVRFLWDRSQFGQPLARFQTLQHRVADLFIDLEMARSHLHGALAGLRAGGMEAAHMTSGCKIAVMRATERVTGECIHLHGAIGMTMEHGIGHYYRRAVSLEKTWGDIDFHLRRYEDISSGMIAKD